MIRNIVYQIVSFIVLGLVAVSCSDDLVEGVKVPGGQDDFWSQFDFVIADNTDTRVSYDTYKRSTFEAGDEVGIYVVDATGTLINGQPTNVHYVVRDVTDLNTGERRQVLLPSDPNTSVGKDANYHYILYYPYNVNMTLTALKSYTHTVDTDQNASSSTYVPELTAFEHSDLLWCYYTPPTGTQTFEVYFDHAMAQIVVELDESEVYAPDDNAEKTGVYLLNMPMQASNINLLQSSEDFSYATTVPTYDAANEEKNPKIHAWKFGSGASGKLQFRAMVPAHIIRYLNEQNDKRPVVRIYSTQDSYKDYYLKSDLTLEPGYTYTFTFSKGQTTTSFEVSEDDSWVLDVLDPETGAPVGLLCREYLRYHPGDRPAEYEGYNYTGIPYSGTTGETKFIDSQAWVFYNLKADGTPDLSKGKVLRFIYDIQLNANGNEDAFGIDQAYAPKPHVKSLRLGIFTPEHGYYWTTQHRESYLDEDQYGTEIKIEGSTDKRENYQNYGMHGGTITWGYADGHSYISSFTLPAHNAYVSSETATVNGVEVTVGDGSGYITNKQAYYFGHIAIDADGNTDISYQPISDDNTDIGGKKVGILQPHYLIDRRINASGTVEENRYPLVKIGHNQFWMSKSLRTNVLTDGTVIPCYNKISTEEGTKPAAMRDGLNWSDEFGMGYVYPFSSSIKNGDSPYDPVNDKNEMHPGLPIISRGNTQEFVPAPCYNLSVVNDDRFVPKSNDNRLYYVMPDKSTFSDMAGYFSERFTAKLCSNQIKLRREEEYLLENGQTGTADELLYDAALYGMTYSNGGTLANYSAANISGFNARAIGYYYSSTAAVNGFSAMTGSVAFILKNTQSSGVEYMSLPIYSPFAYADFDKCYQHSYYSPSTYPTHFFAQVRMVMKYRNQLDNSGAASFVQGLYSSRSTDPVPQTMKGSRVVRVEMEK